MFIVGSRAPRILGGTTTATGCSPSSGRAKLHPKPFSTPPLPKRSGRVMRKVWAHACLLHGLRLAVGNRDRMPLAVWWVAREVGEHHGSVGDAINRLRGHGLLLDRGSVPRRGVSALDDDVPTVERRKWIRVRPSAGRRAERRRCCRPVHPGAAEAPVG